MICAPPCHETFQPLTAPNRRLARPSIRASMSGGYPPTPLNSLLDECVSRARMRWTRSRRPWMLALVDRSPSGDGHRPPVPVVYRGTEGRPGPALLTLDVDGERFAVRRAGDGGTAYDWLSGPNKGYGFGSSRTPNRSVEEHRHRQERVVEPHYLSYARS